MSNAFSGKNIIIQESRPSTIKKMRQLVWKDRHFRLATGRSDNRSSLRKREKLSGERGIFSRDRGDRIKQKRRPIIKLSKN